MLGGMPAKEHAEWLATLKATEVAGTKIWNVIAEPTSLRPWYVHTSEDVVTRAPGESERHKIKTKKISYSWSSEPR